MWINDFQIDKEAGNIGKTDLQFTTQMEFNDHNIWKLKNWLMKDLFVELYHSKPVLREKTAEDGTIQQEVVIASDGLPKTEESLIGVSCFILLKSLGDACRALQTVIESGSVK